MAIAGVSVLAVLAAGGVYVAIGVLWFSPQALGSEWAQAMGYRAFDRIRGARLRSGLLVGALASLVAGVSLDALLKVSALSGPLGGAALGGLAGLGFAAALTAPAAFVEGRSPVLFAISAAFNVVALVAMGAVIGWLG